MSQARYVNVSVSGPCDTVGMNGQACQIIQEAEHLLRGAASSLLEPSFRECIVCFIHRQNSEYGCDGTLRFALYFRDRKAPRATALRSRFERLNSRCDCEVLSRGYLSTFRLDEVLSAQFGPESGHWKASVRTCTGEASRQSTPYAAEGSRQHQECDPGQRCDEYAEFPPVVVEKLADPVCLGVRTGSTRPCELWQPAPPWRGSYLR